MHALSAASIPATDVRPPTLSVILITRNESAVIRRALESVRWADEIVVLDSGSTDDTLAICREYTDQAFVTDWPGFGPQKNRALAHASGDWVLSIDADEWLSDELGTAIREAIQRNDVQGWKLQRLSSFCGRCLHHSGWWPDEVLRLFRRGTGRFTEHRVHERVVVEGRVKTLHGCLMHESYRSVDQLLDKVNHYSREGAQDLWDRGRRAGLGTAIGHGLWAFLRTWIFKRGFLDGREGFIVAVSNAEASYYRYLKLMYLHEAQAPPDHSRSQRGPPHRALPHRALPHREPPHREPPHRALPHREPPQGTPLHRTPPQRARPDQVQPEPRGSAATADGHE